MDKSIFDNASLLLEKAREMHKSIDEMAAELAAFIIANAFEGVEIQPFKTVLSEGARPVKYVAEIVDGAPVLRMNAGDKETCEVEINHKMNPVEMYRFLSDIEDGLFLFIQYEIANDIYQKFKSIKKLHTNAVKEYTEWKKLNPVS